MACKLCIAICWCFAAYRCKPCVKAERERRRMRAQKKEMKKKELESAKESEKNSWLKFTSKATTKGIKVRLGIYEWQLYEKLHSHTKNSRMWSRCYPYVKSGIQFQILELLDLPSLC